MSEYYLQNGKPLFNSANHDILEGISDTGYMVNDTDIGQFVNVKNFEPVSENYISNSGYISNINTYNTGYQWTNSNSGLNGILSVSMSATGQFAVAARYHARGGSYKIYYSRNYGASWNEASLAPTTNPWKAVSMSCSGQNAIASAGNVIYYSNDYGTSWSESLNTFADVRTIAISGNGKNAICASNDGATRVQTYFSFDSGISWSNFYNIANETLLTLATNGSGQFGILGTNSNKIYLSNDFGVTWIKQVIFSGSKAQAVAMSSSGQYAIACVYRGKIYYSKDYGNSWNISETSVNVPDAFTDSNDGYHCASMSSSGQYCLVCIIQESNNSNREYFNDYSKIYYSKDYGKNWEMSLCPKAHWSIVSISGNGKYAIASDSGNSSYSGDIYYSSYFNFDLSSTVISAQTDVLDYLSSSVISSNGSTAITCARNQNKLWRTLNLSSGANSVWSILKSDITQAAMSSNGQYIIASYSKTSSGQIIRSTDYGSTWVSVSFASDLVNLFFGHFITISSSGQYAMICVGVGTEQYPTNQGKVFFSNNYGAYWNIFTLSLGTTDGLYNYYNNFATVAISGDGYKAVLTVYDKGNSITGVSTGVGYIYYATRTGDSWTKDVSWNKSDAPARSWCTSKMSYSGQYVIATYDNSVTSPNPNYQPYISSNYGETWSYAQSITGSILDCAISYTGQYMLVAALDSQLIYFSNTYGQSWLKLPQTSRQYYSVAISPDGKQMFAVASDVGIVVANNAMTTTTVDLARVLEPLFKHTNWYTLSIGAAVWTSIATSYTGQYIILCDQNGNDGRMYYSSNYGGILSQINNISGQLSFQSVSISSDGQYAIGCYNGYYSVDGTTFSSGGSIYYSKNYGQDWILDASMNGNSWTSISMSGSGKYTVVCNNSYIYYSQLLFTRWSLSTTDISSTMMNRNYTRISNTTYTIPNDPNYLYQTTSDGLSIFTISYTIPYASVIWSSISMSASGKYSVACQKVGLLFYSNNFGINWYMSNRIVDSVTFGYTNNQQKAENKFIDGAWRNWYSVSISGNGQYAFACDQNSGALYRSIDYGVNWAFVLPFHWQLGYLCYSVSVSSTGQYVVVSHNSDKGNSLLYSYDFGVTWTPEGTNGLQGNYVVAISGDGQHSYKAEKGGGVYKCVATNI